MSSLRSNFAANVAGQACVALIQLLVIPIYVRLLGIEAYGLIGFFVALQATVQVLDLGVSATVTRELAKSTATPLVDARSFVITAAAAYLCLSLVIALAVIGAAPFLAESVIKAQHLDHQTLQHAVILMGLLIPVLWGGNLLNGALIGLERQVQVNVLRVSVTLLSALGAIGLLSLVAADVTLFFTWQLFAASLAWIAAALMVHRALPAGPASIRPQLLRASWRFAAGMTGISLGAIALMQLDKWLLINLLPLQSYGYYMLGIAVANALYMVITPLFTSVFPRMSALQAAGDQAGLTRLYHSSAQYLSALVLPLAAVISLFPEEILRLWTGDRELAQHVAPVVRLLALGTALNGLMNVPYALQLATGNTGLALRLVILKLLLFVPMIVFFTIQLGVVGAALAWLTLNAFYVVVGIPYTHAKLLRGEARAWLQRDVLPVALIACLAGALASYLKPGWQSAPAMLAFLFASTTLTMLASVIAASGPRHWLASHIGLRRVPR